ncbi:MAG TPA: hypothetical protein ENH82_05515 [bacterium]|nr:hypothetical protein [bacterium]
MSIEEKFSCLIDKHKDRNFLIYCPGKNIREWLVHVNDFVAQNKLITLGTNHITDIVIPDYHIFTNNQKYKEYGRSVDKSSILLLGHINSTLIKKYKPRRYVHVNYTDKGPNESIGYDRNNDVVTGHYRTSGNLSIMLCHLMGGQKIYIAGMSGFTYKFDGDVHYYKAKIKNERKSKKEWYKKYDKPVIEGLNEIRRYGVDFAIITPTIYSRYFDSSILEVSGDE